MLPSLSNSPLHHPLFSKLNASSLLRHDRTLKCRHRRRILPLFSKLNASPPLRHDRTLKCRHLRRIRFAVNAIETNSFESNYSNNQQTQQQKQLRTLFPGGFKRPEIKLPTLILQLSSEEVLKRDGVLDYIDLAVSKWVGIVVLNGGNESGGKLYEAACLLKSVIRDRAYMVIAERVDIAAAVGASGVLLSDQGLPALVARNMMMESKSNSVVLPLVARNVQSANAALSASDSEGADFLIYDVDGEKFTEVLLSPAIQSIKVPVFIAITLEGEDPSLTEASKLLQAGASGLVLSLDDLKLFNDDCASQMFSAVNMTNKRTTSEFQSIHKDRGIHADMGVSGFIKLEDKEKQFIETERMVLLEAIALIRRAAPLMEEVSLLTDAVSQLDDPFLLVIVGEFNSGKSSVINALLGKKYLKEGVVPTTNEITLLCYSEMDNNASERCERHPDGQFICYLPAPILKEMNLVDTPGTNVILQRQQRLTEEFVPRADLILFVISADRPLTESEVAFLRYIQQWKKKVVFVLNKSDLYQNTSELEEAVEFIKENVRMLLNTERVTVYPVSARSAIEAKLSLNPVAEKDHEVLESDARWRSSGFFELENFLLSFLDGSTDTGLERMKLKLGTPIGITDRVIASCEAFVRNDFESANQDLISVNEIVTGAKEYSLKMNNESMSWRRQTLSLLDNAKARAMRLVESTFQLSNLDLVVSYVFKGERTGLMPATLTLQNDIIDPAQSDVQKLLGEFSIWLQSNRAREERLYKEKFQKRWPSFVNQHDEMYLRTYELVGKRDDLSIKVLENFSAAAAAKLFEQEIREVILGTFGGLGAAGLSASLLTSVLPTTLEDLLALGLCSAGGLIAISKFPTRRKEVAEKVQRTADALAREIEEAMQKDLLQTTENLENFVKLISRPYHDAAQQSMDRSMKLQVELTNVEKKLRTLQLDIQNLHVS